MTASLLTIVADSGPLIALDKIELLAHFGFLFQELIIPPIVAREVSPTVRLPSWIVVRPLAHPIDERLITSSLDEGEIEAIALAMELPTHRLLIDELAGRKRANEFGIRVIGTLGLLVTAKEHGAIDRVEPVLQRMTETGFFASPELIKRVLLLAGE